METKHHKDQEIIEVIDRGLIEAGKITVEDGVQAAVMAGRLSVAEAAEIIEHLHHPTTEVV